MTPDVLLPILLIHGAFFFVIFAIIVADLGIVEIVTSLYWWLWVIIKG